MKLSDIYSAKGLKLKARYADTGIPIFVNALLRIAETQRNNEFLISQYGTGFSGRKTEPFLCSLDDDSAQYLTELLSAERQRAFKCMFSLEGAGENTLEIQAYTFETITEYKTPIYIQIPEAKADTLEPEKLYKEYIWEQMGEPALFCLNYQKHKQKNSELRILSGRRFLHAQNNARGIIADRESRVKGGFSVPVSIFLAPEIRFISEKDGRYVNESLARDLDKISNPASYFARWEAYNKLSKTLLDQESEEFGELKYTAYTNQTDLTGIRFEFSVEEELDYSFIGKDLGASEALDLAGESPGNRRKPRQTAVGTIRKISGNKITTYLENAEGFDTIPDSGCLSLYTAGDRFIMARREAARERMLRRETPIRYIAALVEAGASEYNMDSDWGKHKAVTEELKRNFSKAATLNEQQEQALSIAINTPDIAIIQGPPGTGKTTVIKAICERFRELFEADERQKQKLDPEHILRSPKILISSFQNDAVDNAISTPLPGDIPAFRKTAKRARSSTKEQYQKSLDKWYAGVYQSVQEQIDDQTAVQYSKAQRKLCDEYLSYKNSGESLELAADLIRHYLSYSKITYPQQLVEQAEAVIRGAERVAGIDDDVPDPIVARLEAQRLDREAFADDGVRNAKRLCSNLRLRDDVDDPEQVMKCIRAVCDDHFSDTAFEEYVQTVEKLKKQFCTHEVRVNVKDRAVVNRCLVSLSECFTNQYMNTLTDLEGRKSMILSDFLADLEQEYESVVKKYAMTTAATCQTCMDLRDDTQRIFDLVVIDEAARANPLDLFIPMSMGKKIILVGDHKQLPHMLEPDVLKVLQEDPKFKDLPEIEKSLFERMFGMFSKGTKPRAVFLTNQFRMHPEICSFVSDAFYDGELKTAASITPELRSSPSEINHGRALTFVNIPFTKGGETSGVSKSRNVEAEVICEDVKKILKADAGASVGIITFYAAQVTKIRQRLEMQLDSEEMMRIEVGTVDAFQGKEFDYVLLSCVRSNRPKNKEEKPHVGFLEKPNRLCVAFSRAIRQLAVYGDEDTLTQIPCFARLVEICALEGGGCYREI